MNIFIGSSKKYKSDAENIAEKLKELGHTPKLWTSPEVFVATDYTMESLERVSNEVDAAVFIFGNDDKLCHHEESFKVRDNVLLECGLFYGQLSKERVCICRKGKPQIPSDVAGITFIKLDNDEDVNNEENVEKNLKEWLKKVSSKIPRRTLIDVINRNDFNISEYMETASSDIFVSGSGLSSLFKDVNKMKEIKVKVRLLTMDYNDDECANQFCKLTGKGLKPQNMKNEDTGFRILYNDNRIKDNPNIEVRKIDRVMPIVYVGIDLHKTSDKTLIKVQHFLHEKHGSETLNYIVKEEHRLFGIYKEQIETLWSMAKHY